MNVIQIDGSRIARTTRIRGVNFFWDGINSYPRGLVSIDERWSYKGDKGEQESQ